jgi:hypothetical protein
LLLTLLRTLLTWLLVNLGAVYPNQLLTVVLKGDAKQLAGQITDKTITVLGKVIGFKGKPEIVVTDTKAITIDNAERQVVKPGVSLSITLSAG